MSNLDIVNTDENEFKINYPKLLKNIKKKKLYEVDPKINEINEVYQIILNYIKKNKRKIYGGYALNKLLVSKNKNLEIYDINDVPDIDFYSPNPIEDLLNICDELHKKGFKDVQGSEAQHTETYVIFVNYQEYCNISYIPNNIYNHIKFTKIDDFIFVDPWFMMIDYFRMFADPMNSGWRLEKHFPRFEKLQKTYPLPLISKPLFIKEYEDKNINEAINYFFNFITTKKDILLTGFYIYNYYLYISEYQKKNSNYKYISLPFLEAYGDNYVVNGLDLIEFIKVLPEKLSSNISYEEHYPFSQLYGYNVVFYYKSNEKKIPILYFYSNNRRCLPCKKTEYINFSDIAPDVDNNKQILIGSFDFNILHCLIMLVKIRVDEKNELNDIYYKYINGIVLFRKYYLTKEHLTVYDDTIFESFVIECIGEIILPERERGLKRQYRKKLGKPLVFRYDPATSNRPSKFIFLNSSGNYINNSNNLKLVPENLNNLEDIEDNIIEDSIKENIKENTKGKKKEIIKEIIKENIKEK